VHDVPKEERTDPVVVGWRVWAILLGEERLLRSVMVRDVQWPVGKRLESSMPIVSWNLRGVHAWKEMAQGLAYFRDCNFLHSRIRYFNNPKLLAAYAQKTSATVYCWGSVSLWGEIVHHKEGYRAQFAYPRVLHFDRLQSSMAREIANKYGCEVIID